MGTEARLRRFGPLVPRVDPTLDSCLWRLSEKARVIAHERRLRTPLNGPHHGEQQSGEEQPHSDVDREPLPELISEEQQIDSDQGAYHQHDVNDRCHLDWHFTSVLDADRSLTHPVAGSAVEAVKRAVIHG